MVISEKVLLSLEFDKVLNKVKSFLCVEKSAATLAKEKPSENFFDMRERLSITKEADILISYYNFDSINSFDDTENILIKAEKQVTLTISEILKVAGLLRSSRIFKTKSSEINDGNIIIFKSYAALLYTDTSFENECDRCFLSEDQVSDNASALLNSIRKNIRKINEDIKAQLDKILHQGASKYIQDFYITIRNGRYVIPVKAEYKNNIKGMLHDQSASGATVYIEPESVVHLNNELKILQIKEAEEIERILQSFTSLIKTISDCLRQNSETLIKADIAFAKAKYAHSTRAVLPIINNNGYINIVSGRHPLIDKEKIVPVSINLGKEHKYLIITGPNTGGKTVTMKLCGLFTSMALCGMFLPAADGSEVSFFGNIFTDIGDEQSIENNLSTFSSHMKNIIDICANVNNQSLVLIDEIGAGTDPAEGSALALAVFEHLLKTDSKGIITTHYNELKEYAFTNKNALNASMEFDPVRLTPTYRLKLGLPGSSNALEISKKLGLNQDIIAQAYKNLKSEKILFEQVLKSAEEARIKAQKNLDETEIIKKEYEKKLNDIIVKEENLNNIKEKLTANAKTEAKRIYADAVTECENLINELKEIISSEQIAEYDLNRSRQIKKQLDNKRFEFNTDENNFIEKDLQPVSKAEEGMKVYIKSLSKNGIIKSVSKNNITVEADNVTINTKTEDLFLPHSPDIKSKNKKSEINIIKNITNAAGATEIKVLGKTVVEAIPEIDAFLDGCSMSGIKECKIIHGIGKGVLRKAVWEHLKTHPLVDSYRSGKYGEGEKGVTVVSIK